MGALYYLVILPLSKLPTPVLYFLSDGLFYFLYYVSGYRKRVVKENLRNSFPEKSEQEIEKIAQEFFRHLCDLIFESFKGFSISEKEILKRHKYTNIEFLEAYYKAGKQLTILGSHYANWEWVALSLPLCTQFKTYGIYQVLNNAFMNNVIKKSRERNGMTLVSKKELAPTLQQNKGKQLTMGYIGDQSPSKTGRHYWLKFLNQDTAATSGFEHFAKEYNTPVIYLNITKTRRGYYEGTFLPVEDHPQQSPDGEIVETYMRTLEKIIQAKPQHWLWSHRRWKIKRPTKHTASHSVADEPQRVL